MELLKGKKKFISLPKRLTPLYSFIFCLLLVFPPACSESTKVDNPKVEESFVKYATPIIKSLDIEKLKNWGYGPSYNSSKKEFGKLSIGLFPHKSQTKTQVKLGYMSASIKLHGSLKHLDSWKSRTILLEFYKLSHDEPWKLFVNNEAIEDRFYMESLDSTVRILPPEVVKYIKSRFEVLDKWEFVSHPNFLKIMDAE